MAVRFTELVIDSHDPRRLAEFWCEVLGYKILDEEGGVVEIGAEEPSAEEYRAGPRPPTIVFVTVPESKTVKNRVHIDVSPVDTSIEEEVERILALGAHHVDIGQGKVRWVVLADPEGNEFCVLRSLASMI
jgi:catechol 2,3-dioxygenase-like lactoylglutathione lyase family enzyme